ncbi:MAG: response regulator [Verrucomicrobia bacterium]|nr:response regulator [Verrucomicrobiota bacterium]
MITILEIWGVCLFALFIFCLALCRAAKQPIPGLRHPHPAILVMDDNAGVLGMVRMGLENEGYTVHTASSPQEGIQLFREQSHSISLVLLDFSMPEMTGDRVFERLWKIDPEVPVLLMTGFREDIEAARELRNNVQGYLLKPFPLCDLIGRVRELVSHA